MMFKSSPLFIDLRASQIACLFRTLTTPVLPLGLSCSHQSPWVICLCYVPSQGFCIILWKGSSLYYPLRNLIFPVPDHLFLSLNSYVGHLFCVWIFLPPRHLPGHKFIHHLPALPFSGVCSVVMVLTHFLGLRTSVFSRCMRHYVKMLLAKCTKSSLNWIRQRRQLIGWNFRNIWKDPYSNVSCFLQTLRSALYTVGFWGWRDPEFNPQYWK